METITIPKTEYKKLVRKAKAYEKLAGSFYQNTIREPIDSIVSDFRKTNLYTNEFLNDPEDGLRKSSLSGKSK